MAPAAPVEKRSRLSVCPGRSYNLLGGSTNAVVHLTAIAGRLGIELPLEIFDDIGKVTPLLVREHSTARVACGRRQYVLAGLRRSHPCLHCPAGQPPTHGR